MNKIQVAKNFYLSEFQCKCGCGQVILHAHHLENVQGFRDFLNEGRKPNAPEIGLLSNSSYRCAYHNPRVGGVPNSRHRLGIADDWIAAYSQMSVLEMYEKALEYGRFNGVIAYPNRGIVHLDSRKEEVWHKIDYSRGK